MKTVIRAAFPFSNLVFDGPDFCVHPFHSALTCRMRHLYTDGRGWGTMAEAGGRVQRWEVDARAPLPQRSRPKKRIA
eukprot:scaffold228_cov312-Pinguiococcus_pyrenoidosus.AAC.66